MQGINRLMDCVQIMGIGAAQVIAMLQIGELLLKQWPVSDVNYMAQESIEPGTRAVGKVRYSHRGAQCKNMTVNLISFAIIVKFIYFVTKSVLNPVPQSVDDLRFP